jgi:N6-L-threonylcarbamoyladenine synthase
MLTLGIESSCDETAAAVIEDGRKVLSNVIASQIQTHAPFGGVVPELASREHLNRIAPVVGQALADAQVTLAEIDGIAVTQGPGLSARCWSASATPSRSPLRAQAHRRRQSHRRSHLFGRLREPAGRVPGAGARRLGRPHDLFLMPEKGSTRSSARTRDDAAGEAYDKVAKMLGLGYPGGPIIDRLAREGDAARLSGLQLPRMRRLASTSASAA